MIAMTSYACLLSLFCCVVASPQKLQHSANDKVSNLEFLIPMRVIDPSPPSRHPRAYWQPDELVTDERYSDIPAESFARDDLLTDLDFSNKKTVKKDLSRFDPVAIPKQLPRVTHVTKSDTKKNNYLPQCEKILQKHKSGRSDINDFLGTLCLVHMKLNSDPSEKTLKFRSRNSRGKDKGGVLANLLGNGFRVLEGNLGGSFFSNDGRQWTGQSGNFAVNGQGGHAGNIGVGGKGQQAGNVAVGGHGGVYGNMGVGGKGGLFGNIGIGGVGGQYNPGNFADDDVTDNFEKTLLNFLLNGGYGQNAVPTATKPIGNLDAKLKDRILNGNRPQNNEFTTGEQFGQLDSGNGPVMVNTLDGDVASKESQDGLNVVVIPNFATESNDQIKNIQLGSIADIRNVVKKISKDLRDDDGGRCELRSVLLNGRGGLVGNLAIEGYSFGRLPEKKPCVRAYVVVLGDSDADTKRKPKVGNELKQYIEMKKYKPYNGRRKWTAMGNPHDLRKPWLLV